MALQKHKDIQLIHCNDGTCGLLCSWVKLITKVPLTLTYHGLDLVYPNKIYQNVLLPLVKKLDGFICVSNYTAEQCKARGFDSAKIFIAPNGVDTELMPATNPQNEVTKYFDILKSHGKQIIVSIGRPVKRKGFSWFIQKVLTQLPDNIHYIIIGPKPKINPVIKILKKFIPSSWLKSYQLLMGVSTDADVILKLEKEPEYKSRFDWLSQVDYPTLRYMLSQSDVFVMPNVSVEGDAEGFGLVALEAVMEGAPVIASRLEGITSAVHHWQNGILVSSENQKEWKGAVESQLSSSNAEQYEQTYRARTYVKQQFPWHKMVNKYSDCFSLIIQREEAKSLSPEKQFS